MSKSELIKNLKEKIGTEIHLIKELREKSGVGMLECKKALEESNYDIEQAIDILRTKGIASAAKKASNTANEGLVAFKIDGLKGVVLEVNSQTDFVAKNDKFQNLVKDIVNEAIKANNLEELKSINLNEGTTVADKIAENVGAIGENIVLQRFKSIEVKSGLIASYVHNEAAKGMGKIAVLVALESDLEPNKLQDLGKDIAMHIAAATPLSVDARGIDPQVIKREENIAYEHSNTSGKPENVILKMVEGKMRKFYEEKVLLEQIFVKDSKIKIADLISKNIKELQGDIKIAGFIRFEVGEKA